MRGPWTDLVIIDEETFAGPSVKQFAQGQGMFRRLLNLNEVGSWTTMWIVFLVSWRCPYPGWGNKGAGVESTWPKGINLVYGIGSSAGILPNEMSSEFSGPEGKQFVFSATSFAGTAELGLDSSGTGQFCCRTATWTGVNKNGVGTNFSGGAYTVHRLTEGPSIRRPIVLTIAKSSTWYIGASFPNVWTTLADVTKQDCKDWLLGSYASTSAFLAARPSGNSYGSSANIGVDLEPGTYGELDTLFLKSGKFPLDWKVHGVWGRTHASFL